MLEKRLHLSDLFPTIILPLGPTAVSVVGNWSICPLGGSATRGGSHLVVAGSLGQGLHPGVIGWVRLVEFLAASRRPACYLVVSNSKWEFLLLFCFLRTPSILLATHRGGVHDNRSQWETVLQYFMPWSFSNLLNRANYNIQTQLHVTFTQLYVCMYM